MADRTERGAVGRAAFRVMVEALCPHTDCSHQDTYGCTGWAYAEDALRALEQAGYRLVPPDDFPGLCPACKTVIEDGTRHQPFNGNQMFACEIVRLS